MDNIDEITSRIISYQIIIAVCGFLGLVTVIGCMPFDTAFSFFSFLLVLFCVALYSYNKYENLYNNTREKILKQKDSQNITDKEKIELNIKLLKLDRSATLIMCFSLFFTMAGIASMLSDTDEIERLENELKI